MDWMSAMCIRIWIYATTSRYISQKFTMIFQKISIDMTSRHIRICHTRLIQSPVIISSSSNPREHRDRLVPPFFPLHSEDTSIYLTVSFSTKYGNSDFRRCSSNIREKIWHNCEFSCISRRAKKTHLSRTYGRSE